MQQDCPKTPDYDGGISTIDGAIERQLTEACRLLAEVYQLLNEYSPLWYPEDLHYRLEAALRSPKRNTRPRVVGNSSAEPIKSRNFAPPQTQVRSTLL
jgi:predicted transcriptional regulator of viral defense system